MDNYSWKILLVEDDADDYLLTREWLSEIKRGKFELEWASSVNEALSILKKTPFDAILVDYDLGDRSGTSLIKEAIAAGVEGPFIMLTGRGSYDVDMEAMQAGASDYLSKIDSNANLLERSIRYAIDRAQAEKALHQAQNELEERVRQRTKELHQANQNLSQANDQLRKTNELLESKNSELEREVTERIHAQAQLAYHAKLLEDAQVQLKQYAERNAALANISQALAEAGGDFQRVLDTIVHTVCELIGDTAIIALISEETGLLSIAASATADPEVDHLLRECFDKAVYALDDSLTGKVAKTGEPVLIPEIDPERLSKITDKCSEYLARSPLYSALVVPLRVHGRVIGTLNLTRQTPGKPYGDDDQVFLLSLADRAAVAIENSRLFQVLQVELAERRRAEVMREQAEAAIRQSEARFRAIYEGSAIGIELRGLDGKILAANSALCEMLGYTEDELKQHTDQDITYLEDIPANTSLFKALVKGRSPRYHSQKRYLRKDGNMVWARLAVSLIRDELGNPQFAIVMIENITESVQMEARLAEVRRRLIHSRESERLSLAQDLHDGPVQDLYAITYQIAGIRDEPMSPKITAELDSIKDKIDEVVRVLRAMSVELRPPTLSSFGLEKTIRSHADNFLAEHSDIEIFMSLQPDEQRLPEPIRLALFRIYQQALVNIVRHAHATRVEVDFHFDDQKATLKITDNGSGFIVPEDWIDFARDGHLGLAGSAERANAVGGILKVVSQLDKGTAIIVEVPLIGNSHPVWQGEPFQASV